MQRRHTCAVIALAAIAATTTGASWAQGGSYPSAPITMVVPFAAGSGTDAVARAVGQELGKRLKQPVIVDNRAGANAQIAAGIVAKAKPDGYTLFMTTNTSHSANPWRSPPEKRSMCPSKPRTGCKMVTLCQSRYPSHGAAPDRSAPPKLRCPYSWLLPMI